METADRKCARCFCGLGTDEGNICFDCQDEMQDEAPTGYFCQSCGKYHKDNPGGWGCSRCGSNAIEEEYL